MSCAGVPQFVDHWRPVSADVILHVGGSVNGGTLRSTASLVRRFAVTPVRIPKPRHLASSAISGHIVMNSNEADASQP